MALPPGQAAMARKPPKRAAQPQKYFTFNPKDPRSHLKIGAGQHAAFAKDLGWYAAAGAPGKAKLTGTVARGGGTPQNQTTIETADQIEQRVSRMAQTVYDRQKSDLKAEADLLRKDAEGRRLGLIDAYKAAQAQTEGMGGKIQEAWTAAANNLSGIAGITSGSIADTLQAEAAGRESALARVGAAGTGFDARSQANVEAYRGGVIPGEEFTRLGAVGNEYILRAVDNLRKQGLQTGDAGEKAERAKINADLMKGIAGLQDKRTEYETTLRKEFSDAQATQAEALATQQKLKIAADKQVFDAKMAVSKLEYQYWNAKQSATTKKELAAVDMVYKQQKLALQQETDAALINQRNASAALSGVKTAAGGFAPKTPPGKKPLSPTAVSNNVARGTKAGTARLETSLDRIWDATPGGDVPVDMDEDEYFATPAGKKALALYEQKKTQAFGTIMGHVVREITPHLKAVRYTPAQIKNVAYNIVSAKIRPPKVWPPKPKTPKKK